MTGTNGSVTRRLWTTRSKSSATPLPTGPGWHCQLIHVDDTDSAFLLDFIALDEPPVAALALPTGTPFSLLIHHGAAEPAAAHVATITRWASDADIVTITVSDSSRSCLLCLSAEQCCLVLEIASD